jgi:hypothetical protein
MNDTKIKTYPVMKKSIKDILGLSDKFSDQYVVARLEELEEENERYRQTLKEIVDIRNQRFNDTPSEDMYKLALKVLTD